jgi:glycosyltransferase involved in cell wall biosynthesis/uncharacterized membrane protein YbhN (UPF0104 family)
MAPKRIKPFLDNRVLKKSWSIGFLIFSLLVGVGVSFLALRDDLNQFQWRFFFDGIGEWLTHWPMMLVALFMYALVVLTSGLRFHALLTVKRKKQSLSDSLRFGILARYYVLITPWALGSQPILMGLMFKKNVPVGLATATPMIDLLIMRLAMALIVLVALLGFGHLVDPVIYTLAWIGFAFTCISPIVLVFGSLHPVFANAIIRFLQMIMPRKKQQISTSLQTIFLQYRQAFNLYQGHLLSLAIVSVYALISQIAILSIPYFLLASFDTSLFEVGTLAFTYVHVVMMMALANVILGVVPTLGSAGAAEFTFATVFSIFLTGSYLFWVIFLWRFLLFYLWLLMGVIITFYLSLFHKNEERRHHVPKSSLPLKVFLFNDGFYPIVDGAVRSLDGYARYLVSQGIDVTVVVPYRGQTQTYPYRILSVKQLQVPGFVYPIPLILNQGKLADQLYYEGPAIYHAHSPFLLGRLAQRLAKKMNMPLVTTFHHKYQLPISYKSTWWLTSLIQGWTIKYFKRAEVRWTVDEALMAYLRLAGLNDRPWTLMPSGTSMIPHPASKAMANTLLQKYKLSEEKATLLFFAQQVTSQEWKQWDALVQALLKEEGLTQIILMIDGITDKDIHKLEKQYSWARTITIIPRMHDYETMSALLTLAQLLVIPFDRIDDPMLLADAAVHQLPSLVNSHSTLATSITDQGNGFIFQHQELASRITEILAHPLVLKRVGLEASKTLVVRWEERLKDLITRYQSIIETFYSN